MTASRGWNLPEPEEVEVDEETAAEIDQGIDDMENGRWHTEEEVRQVLVRRGDDFQGRRSSRIRFGQTLAGRYLKVIYVPDEERDSVFVITAYDLRGKAMKAFRRRQRRKRK